MLPPGAIFQLKIHQNAFEAGVSPRTPLGGGAYSSPQTPSRLTGAASGQAREAEEMGRDREVEKGKGTGRGGERSPPSFFPI